jgi:hypothetical protein
MLMWDSSYGLSRIGKAPEYSSNDPLIVAALWPVLGVALVVPLYLTIKIPGWPQQASTPIPEKPRLEETRIAVGEFRSAAASRRRRSGGKRPV